MGKELYYLLALSAGVAVAIQAGVNSELKLAVGNPIITALFSFCIGTLILGTVVLVSYRQEFPSLQQMQGISAWKWTGGLLGVLYVTAVILAAPRIGAANTLGIIVAGQLLMAIVLDHFGWLGFPVQPINWNKVLGVVLLLAGVFLLRKV
jgi:bacterial/archaeal transporter family-2 protein